MALGPDFYDYKEDFVPDEPFLLLFVGRSLGDDLSLVYPADVYLPDRGFKFRPGLQPLTDLRPYHDPKSPF